MAEKIAKRGITEAVILLKVVLTLLSTRLGTLLLCGWLCLEWRWPFIHKFTEISLEKREKLLQRWSRESYWTSLRVVFLFIKVASCFIFFSRVTFFFFHSFLLYPTRHIGLGVVVWHNRFKSWKQPLVELQGKVSLHYPLRPYAGTESSFTEGMLCASDYPKFNYFIQGI